MLASTFSPRIKYDSGLHLSTTKADSIENEE